MPKISQDCRTTTGNTITISEPIGIPIKEVAQSLGINVSKFLKLAVDEYIKNHNIPANPHQ